MRRGMRMMQMTTTLLLQRFFLFVTVMLCSLFLQTSTAAASSSSFSRNNHRHPPTTTPLVMIAQTNVSLGEAWRTLPPLPSRRTQFSLAASSSSSSLSTCSDGCDSSSTSPWLAFVGGLEEPHAVDVWHVNQDLWRHARLREPRKWSATAVLEDQLYVCGGNPNQKDDLTTCEVLTILSPNDATKATSIFSTDTEQAEETVSQQQQKPTTMVTTPASRTLPPMRRARYASAAVIHPETRDLYIVGGWDGHERLQAVEILDTVTETWREGPAMLQPRSHLAAMTVPGGIVVLGGYGRDGVAICDVEVLQVSTGQWFSLPPMKTCRARFQAVRLTPMTLPPLQDDNHEESWSLMVAGGYGYTVGEGPSVEVYESKHETWYAPPHLQDLGSSCAKYKRRRKNAKVHVEPDACRLAMMKMMMTNQNQSNLIVAVGDQRMGWLDVSIQSLSNSDFSQRLANLHRLARTRDDVVNQLAVVASSLGQLSQISLLYTMIHVQFALGVLTQQERRSLIRQALDRCVVFCVSSEHLAFYDMVLEKAQHDGIIDHFEAKTFKNKALKVDTAASDFGETSIHREFNLMRKRIVPPRHFQRSNVTFATDVDGIVAALMQLQGRLRAVNRFDNSDRSRVAAGVSFFHALLASMTATPQSSTTLTVDNDTADDMMTLWMSRLVVDFCDLAHLRQTIGDSMASSGVNQAAANLKDSFERGLALSSTPASITTKMETFQQQQQHFITPVQSLSFAASLFWEAIQSNRGMNAVDRNDPKNHTDATPSMLQSKESEPEPERLPLEDQATDEKHEEVQSAVDETKKPTKTPTLLKQDESSWFTPYILAAVFATVATIAGSIHQFNKRPLTRLERLATVTLNGWEGNPAFVPRLSTEDREKTLFAAIRFGSLDDFHEVFLDSPELDVNELDSAGRTPADFAAVMGEVEMMEFLLQRGARFRLANKPTMKELARKRQAEARP